jgi:hypothetical protein
MMMLLSSSSLLPPRGGARPVLSMAMTVPVAAVLLLLAVIPTGTHGLNGRCGDCWCITGSEDPSSCPTDTTGVTDSFVSDEGANYLSHVLTNPDADFLQLQTSDGVKPCFPFSDALGGIPITDYPLSSEPQCSVPSATDNGNATVCAYLYEDATATSCLGRNYEVVTYPTEEDAFDAGAAVVHRGGE